MVWEDAMPATKGKSNQPNPYVRCEPQQSLDWQDTPPPRAAAVRIFLGEHAIAGQLDLKPTQQEGVHAWNCKPDTTHAREIIDLRRKSPAVIVLNQHKSNCIINTFFLSLSVLLPIFLVSKCCEEVSGYHKV